MRVDVFNQAKRIGSIFCLTGMIWGAYAADDQVSITVQSVQGVPLTSVAVGKPFTLLVTAKNPGRIRSFPRVEGLTSFHVAGQNSQTMQSQSNGTIEEEITAQYTLVAEKPGTYVLGPARFSELPGKQSGSVSIEVVESGKDQKKTEYEAPKLTLKLTKTEAFVGEKVPFALRFSWQEPDLKPIHLGMPQLQDVQIKEVSKGNAKTERKGDQVYNVIEFTGDLYPEHAGLLRIPQLRADYVLPQLAQRWSTFFPFQMQTRESAFSPSVQLMVHELPPTDKKIVGVGNFKRFAATISAQEIPRGEAGTLILSVQGDADFAQLKAPTPNLPESFRAYPSKTTLERNGSGVQWSYVIQGLKEGSYTIPAQELTYFDTNVKAYKTLHSQPLSLTITQGSSVSTSTNVSPHLSEEEPEEVSNAEEQQKTAVPEIPQIPLGWFILLMLLPPLYALCRYIGKLGAPLFEKFLLRRRSWRALKKGSQELRLLEKRDDAAHVYDSIKQSLATFLRLEDPRDEDIIIALKVQGYSEKTTSEVAQLLQDALQVSSYAAKGASQKDRALFSRALNVLAMMSNRAKALLIACILMTTLKGVDAASLIAQAQLSLGVIPFVVWQMGVLIGWWFLWFAISRISSELRSAVLILWFGFLIGWALRLPKELYPLAFVTQEVELYMGPSETYPSRAVLEPFDELALVKKEGAWYYVSSTKGKGWVPATFIDKKVAL